MQWVKEPTQEKRGRKWMPRLTQYLHCQVNSKKQKDLEPTPDTAWPQLYGTGDQQTRDFMSTVVSGSDVPIYFMYKMSRK